MFTIALTCVWHVICFSPLAQVDVHVRVPGIVQVDVQAGQQPGVEVLTRGPVHEAFAETVVLDPQPGVIVSKPPPPFFDEDPPDQRPAGANVAWIPGYWAWDDERNDYLWVSGVWRVMPPGREWVPGYWVQVGQGYQWSTGYWADSNVNEAEYLPAPPAAIETAPPAAAPAANVNWIPGTWVWTGGRYAWRAGYWAAGRPDWDWIPAHYIWSPRGYLYCAGYWDYPVEQRGVLFAPVYIDTAVYQQKRAHYSPSIVINTSVLTNQLFVRPRYGHYYFGDYYGARYESAGYYSPFTVESRRYVYDPIYVRQRWDHRSDHEWEHHAEADFRYRRDHDETHPPRTYAAQVDVERRGEHKGVSAFIGVALDQFAKRNDHPSVRLEHVHKDERNSLAQIGRQLQTFRDERQKIESRRAEPAKVNEPVKLKMAKPVIQSKPAAQLPKPPPAVHRTPQPDPKVSPKGRPATPTPPPGQEKDKKPPPGKGG